MAHIGMSSPSNDLSLPRWLRLAEPGEIQEFHRLNEIRLQEAEAKMKELEVEVARLEEEALDLTGVLAQTSSTYSRRFGQPLHTSYSRAASAPQSASCQPPAHALESRSNGTHVFNLLVDEYECPRCDDELVEASIFHDHLIEHSLPLAKTQKGVRGVPLVNGAYEQLHCAGDQWS